MKNLVKRFIREEQGLETVEWTLMAALIILGLVGVIVLLQNSIGNVFNAIKADLDNNT